MLPLTLGQQDTGWPARCRVVVAIGAQPGHGSAMAINGAAKAFAQCHICCSTHGPR